MKRPVRGKSRGQEATSINLSGSPKHSLARDDESSQGIRNGAKSPSNREEAQDATDGLGRFRYPHKNARYTARQANILRWPVLLNSPHDHVLADADSILIKNRPPLHPAEPEEEGNHAMWSTRSCVLSPEQLAEYDEKGFVDSLPVLMPEEVQYYRGHVERTWAALGGRVTRADGLHLFFRWAWELASHPRLLDCMESLLGPDIILKHTRIFYKYGRTAAWVGWHQDGYTERLTEGRAPAIWLGLTEATVENGCLRVVPRSHRLGILGASRPPRSSGPGQFQLPGAGPVDKPWGRSIAKAGGDHRSHRPTA